MKIKLTSLVLAAACLALPWAMPGRLRAATISVSNTNDSGPGSLRAALAGATDGDTIDATGVSGTITLTSGQLTVSNSVTILGPGPGTLAVSGYNASRVFEAAGTNVMIRGLKIANGQGALYGAGIRTSGGAGSVVTVSDCVVTNNSTTLLGAGIFNSQGVTLTVSNCTISGNSASSGNAGGIYNSNATLTVIASTLSGNFAYYVGGGIFNDGSAGSATVTVTASTLSSNSAYSGGGILNYGQSGSATLTISACTLSGNRAYSDGGGAIYNNGWYGNGTVVINASTISSNSAAYGGAIFSDGYQGVAAVQIGDTILNGGGAGANIYNGSGTVTSGGYNLSSDDGGGFLTATGDQTNTAPLLGPLQNNGGPTWTHALLTNSPAIDQGKSDAIPALARATDQRGALRIVDWPAVTNAAGGDGSDIGALEVQYIPPAQPSPAAAYTFTTLAGYAGTGSADGIGSAAQFNRPKGVAVDSAGNLYVADTWNSTIRKITSAGVVSTIAGFAGSWGSADGTNSAARFVWPSGIALDNAGNVYVTDRNCTIRKLTPVGANWVVTTVAGLWSPGSADGTNGAARFNNPDGLALDSAGNLYVADSGNFTIRKITPVGTNWVVSTIAGQAGISGSADGLGTNAQFGGQVYWTGCPGLAVDSATNVYVADTYNDTIRKITPLGTNWLVSTLAGSVTNSGSTDGTNGAARFNLPFGIAVDSATNLFVADFGNDTLRRITPVGTNWVVSTLAGCAGTWGNADGTGTNAQFSNPVGVALDSSGNVFVADQYNCAIRAVTSAGVVSTIAGAIGSEGSANGTGGTARFYWPFGAAVGGSGNLYVADTYNHTIRKITSAGVVSTIAGLATSPGSADGAGNNARFNMPFGVAADSAGTVYVADYQNSTIRKITPAGVVSTLAGLARHYGTNDGTGSNARFAAPEGVAVDSAGNLYVADSGNFTIRKITPVGSNWVVSTIAGQAGVSGNADGLGANARFGTAGPSGLAVDGATNLFVADPRNCTIRKITPVGTNWVVSTIAGFVTYGGSADGIGTNAAFYLPYGVAVDGSGNVFVADLMNSLIRKLTPTGTSWMVSTIGGLAGSQGSADGAGRAALFYCPYGVAVDGVGNVYVADSYNNTIRKGVFTAYTATRPVPYTLPPMNGRLVVTVLPAEANGQWRFPWEIAWRNSSQVASNLVPGNYPVEFRNVPGWLAIPPGLPSVQVTDGGVTSITTNVYFPTFTPEGTNSTSGSLTVNLGPSPPSGAGWRFLGDSGSFLASGYTTNLMAGTYLIEFAGPFSGRSTPPSASVQVFAGLPTVISVNYLLAASPPGGVLLPKPVPSADISDLTNYPFGFNGQLQSDVGYGSGVAVQWNVVLTAAHLVFKDENLSYASQVYWRFRQEAGVISAQPQAARGWYVLSGYAAQRTNDMQVYAPGTSTPQSRNVDVAALYFLSPVAGGGYGGYLPSDAVPNSWLTGTSMKMLVGYPVDGSLFGDASIVPGLMYQTDPQPYPLSPATDPVVNQQVYLAPWFLSYPGNSGGPFYVQFNGYYYPAAVYLGTLYNGVQPYASVVRAIDSAVVNLITNAATLGDTGTNYTGGGVITIRAGSGSGQLAYLQVNIGPQAALGAGAAWRLQGTMAWSGGPTYTATIAAGDSVTLEFKPISGWNVPADKTAQIALGTLTVVPATYTLNPARLVVIETNAFTASGFAGGPFSPSSATYTLTNSGGASLDWSASKTAAWLSLSASSGTLGAGAKTTVTVSLNANASNLGPGNYSNTLGFTNLSNGLGNAARSVTLTAAVHPPVQLINPHLLTNGNLAMTLEGVTNRVYAILGTTNLLAPLTNWTEVLRLTNTAGQTRFTNPPSPASPFYYRAKEL